MRAARHFLLRMQEEGLFDEIDTVVIELYGSLAMTGLGHATDKAVLLGLEGETPEGVDPDAVDKRIAHIKKNQAIKLLGAKSIDFSPETELLFLKGKRLPFHSNAMKFKVFSAAGAELAERIYYSVGGGFIVTHEEMLQKKTSGGGEKIPFPYTTYAELLAHCGKKMLYDVVMENEKAHKSEAEVRQGILGIWKVMQECVQRGVRTEGILPGGLEVRRRAPILYRQMMELKEAPATLAQYMAWVSLFALAVNEENAAAGRVVTAPTNGASGVIPAVLHYYEKFTAKPSEEGIVRFFLTAAAMGTLYKEKASLSAAEMGCMGEVGVACSMAAAGLAAALGGTNEQIENAAEIGMEHNLGLTCDPIAGLVQIPCIERNTMGALKAINAAELALRGDGSHRVSLDQVIATMRQTGEDMKSIYKETSEGGLALHVPVSVPQC